MLAVLFVVERLHYQEGASGHQATLSEGGRHSQNLSPDAESSS